MGITPTQQRLLSEMPEEALSGPFGGIQSDLPAHLVERYGFADCLNIILRNGAASTRPSYVPLALTIHGGGTIAKPAIAIADFYGSTGTRYQCLITETGLFKWNPADGDWTQVTGTLTGAAGQYATWTVVNGKLLFSQGKDKIWAWNGTDASFAAVSSDAPAAYYLCEIYQYCIAANTYESAVSYPTRIRWCSPGDPTVWVTPYGGSKDILGNLGPITGVARVLQQGYVWHYGGITQLIPTNNGLDPFAVVPFGDRGKGNAFPYSLATHGDYGAAYVGKQDVFLFNGTDSEPIGSRPIEGNKRVGARALIMADLAVATPTKVHGFISTDINSLDFNAYWLVIPGMSTWIYNFDEGNWSRFVYDKTPLMFNRFFYIRGTPWTSLVGAWSAQTSTWSSLSQNGAFDSMGVAFSDNSVAAIDFTNYSETPWLIKSGSVSHSDRRHQKEWQRFRIVYNDIAPVGFTVTFKNELGQSDTKAISVGTGSGKVLTTVVTTHLSGLYLEWSISGAAGAAASFLEFAPIYNIGGEYKNN